MKGITENSHLRGKNCKKKHFISYAGSYWRPFNDLFKPYQPIQIQFVQNEPLKKFLKIFFKKSGFQIR